MNATTQELSEVHMSNEPEYRCDHCGKPELFNVLCPDCEQLCCTECGRVECCCRAVVILEETGVEVVELPGIGDE